MKWDLSDLYRSSGDAKIKRDVAKEKEHAIGFQRRYKGKVGTLSIAGAKKALLAYERILQEAAKPVHFAHLLFSADTRPHEHGALLQKTEEVFTFISNQLRFFELELIRIPENRFRKLVQAEELKAWQHFLERIDAFRHHHLSEAEENIVEEKGAIGARAWSRFFTREHASKRYTLPKKWKKREVGESEALKMLYDPDRKKRMAAHQAFTNGLKQEIGRSVFVFNTKLHDKAINDKLFRYRTPEEARHLDNEISQKAVDALTESVRNYFFIVHDYYRLKRRVLGYAKLYDYDRYAPIGATNAHFSFAEAQRIVVRSFSHFSEVFGEIARDFFSKRWIDADVRDGKAGGAFCSPVTPDLHPYVLVNYHGTPRDVMTLAHELGHGVHMYLSRGNGYLTYQGPLTLAETASVFGELLVFDALMKKLKKPQERFALLASKIEDVFSTVFRQIAMFQFERNIHDAFRQQGELAPATFNLHWRETQEEMFGSSVSLTPAYDLWWGYVSHFVHTPFYVYAYAFGQLLTFSLWERYQREGETFMPHLVKLLKAGDSASPQNLLRGVGVDVERARFWNEGLEVIKRMVGEAKKLSKEV